MDMSTGWLELYKPKGAHHRKSKVVALSWSAEGEKLCIAYEEGTVSAFHVSGLHLWTRERLLGTDAEQSITAVAWSPALGVHRAGLLTPDDAVQPGDKKEDKESGGDAAMQRQSKAAAEKGKVGAGSRTGAIEVEQDAEKLLAEPQKYVSLGNYAAAIDAYLALSVTTGRRSIHTKLLKHVWSEVLELAENRAPERYPGVVDTVARQMQGAGLHHEAAGLMQSIQNHQGAVDAFLAGSKFDEARQAAKRSDRPHELLARIEKAERGEADPVDQGAHACRRSLGGIDLPACPPICLPACLPAPSLSSCLPASQHALDGHSERCC